METLKPYAFRYAVGSGVEYFHALEHMLKGVKVQKEYDIRHGQASGKFYLQRKDPETGEWFTFKTV